MTESRGAGGTGVIRAEGWKIEPGRAVFNFLQVKTVISS